MKTKETCTHKVTHKLRGIAHPQPLAPLLRLGLQ